MNYRDQRPILAVIGALFLFVGILSAFLGPVEMCVFYLFSEGGVSITKASGSGPSCLATLPYRSRATT